MKKSFFVRVIEAILFTFALNAQAVMVATFGAAIVLMYGSSLAPTAFGLGLKPALITFVWMMAGLAVIGVALKPLKDTPTGYIIYNAFTNMMVVLGTLSKVAMSIGLITAATPFETALIDGIISAFVVYGLLPKLKELFLKAERAPTAVT